MSRPKGFWCIVGFMACPAPWHRTARRRCKAVELQSHYQGQSKKKIQDYIWKMASSDELLSECRRQQKPKEKGGKERRNQYGRTCLCPAYKQASWKMANIKNIYYCLVWKTSWRCSWRQNKTDRGLSPPNKTRFWMSDFPDSSYIYFK